MDKYFFVNPKPIKDVFTNANYYLYIERSIKEQILAKLYADEILPEAVLQDFNAYCTLLVTEKNEVLLFQKNRKIVPKNQSEILNVILGKTKTIIQDADIKLILEGTGITVDKFLTSISLIFEASM